MPNSSPAQTQFVALLREMFQIQDLDLDFGIYRVLNQEKKLISDFLDGRLAPITREALGAADDTVRASLESEMAEVVEASKKHKFPLEESDEYKRIKSDLDTMPNQTVLETEVYNGLCEFFGRYYDKGDFLSRPRYKKDVYALPYNGEEVKLHWANRDQYYIKSAQVLEAFDWNLNGQKVRFQIREAGTAENNTKEERSFVLALDKDENENETPVVSEENGVLTVWFDFKKNSGDQRKLNSDAEKNLSEWSEGQALVAPILAPFNEKKSHFLHRLNSWTARKDFDFFVHKDLRGFLQRELDFFLKNEVVRLDDLFADKAAMWEKTTLAKACAMHKLGGKIIDFLASLENLQKRLWEKRKWVTRSTAIVPLRLIPAALREEVLNNAAQIAEWKTLYGVDSVPNSVVLIAWSEPPSADWTEQNGDIAVDTKHFDAAFARRLWSELSREHALDELWNGVLWNADNFAALNLMQARFAESVKCIYIDPPYNTGGDGFLYKDAYQHSSWLSMMQDRLELGRKLMSETAPILISLDEEEQAHFEVLGECIFPNEYVSTMIWEGGRKNDSRLISISHEYVLCYVKNKELKLQRKETWGIRKEGIDDIYRKAQSLLRQHGTEYRLVSSLMKEWFEGLPDNNPAKRQKQYWAIDKRGVYFPSDISWPGGGGPRYEVIHPITGNPCTIPARGWMFPTAERMQEMIADDRVHFSEDDTKVPCSKAYLKDNEMQTPNSVFYQDGRAAMKRLRHIMGNDVFSNPKDGIILANLLKFTADSGSLILDYFAGSGTTGHAVINLNRADGENGQRKYLLVEQGKYFDSVLVPRLKKAAFADKWRDGKPIEYSNRGGVAQTLLCYRLESYEDALEHLAAVVEKSGQLQIAAPDDDFTVRYALSTQTRDGELPLSDELFRAPFAMQMRVGGNDVKEAQTVTPDAIATFNWLLGLRVQKMWFPSDKLAAVCGLLPDNRAAVIVWRHLEGETFESADAALHDFWQTDEILKAWRETHAPDVVYVNGDSTLGAVLETIELAPLEATFRELMFASVRGAN